MSKKVWQSKTMWTSLATVFTGVGLYINGEQNLESLLISVVGVVFMVLRTVTETKLEK